jgi:hypothetical protein
VAMHTLNVVKWRVLSTEYSRFPFFGLLGGEKDYLQFELFLKENNKSSIQRAKGFFPFSTFFTSILQEYTACRKIAKLYT